MLLFAEGTGEGHTHGPLHCTRGSGEIYGLCTVAHTNHKLPILMEGRKYCLLVLVQLAGGYVDLALA